jgi:hypothetical protein
MHTFSICVNISSLHCFLDRWNTSTESVNAHIAVSNDMFALNSLAEHLEIMCTCYLLCVFPCHSCMQVLQPFDDTCPHLCFLNVWRPCRGGLSQQMLTPEKWEKCWQEVCRGPLYWTRPCMGELTLSMVGTSLMNWAKKEYKLHTCTPTCRSYSVWWSRTTQACSTGVPVKTS